MTGKRFILNADDFGMSKAFNRAVLEGYAEGLLKSASLTANGKAFDDAVNAVIPKCPDLGVGIHLNIIEGKSLCSDVNTLIDSDGNFCNSYGQLLWKAYNPKETEFLADVEREFRVQIEKVLSAAPVTHIDSHVHTHSIPKIFEIVCRLAKEYGIKQVRTQFEKPYIIPDLHKHLTIKYPINLIKVALLDTFTAINETTVNKWGLKTNEFLIGVTYTSMMDALAVSYGVMAVNYDNTTIEALIHPCRYDDGTIDNHFTEFMITKNKKLKEKIESMGFEITNYVEKEA
ncbi:MAG: ChbG/HpnK family deacetylase [Candidatus Gastranaerophilales bacterium]|nr:ChbG/HpnK family deacetylase [Candidatus Gastranaerophilales bacterium]MCM1072379.1 ChbG/HpnK family deacetylase [Bacteroides sp.]